MAWELCSKDDVMAMTSVSEDELRAMWSEVSEQMIRDHMGTPNLGTSSVITAEIHNGDDTPMLMVREPIIMSVSAVRVSSGLITASDYEVFENYVELTSAVFPKGLHNVEIDYTSGGAVIARVRLTATLMVIACLNYRRRRSADTSSKFAVPDSNTGEETPSMNVGLVSHLQQIMEQSLERQVMKFG